MWTEYEFVEHGGHKTSTTIKTVDNSMKSRCPQVGICTKNIHSKEDNPVSVVYQKGNQSIDLSGGQSHRQSTAQISAKYLEARQASGKATSRNVTKSRCEGHEAKGRGEAHHEVFPAKGRKAAPQATKGTVYFPTEDKTKS